MFLKRISKSIAIALVSITIATPLMNTASAMEMNENQDISSLSMDVETVDELNMNEIKVNLDKSDFEEIQLIILDIENNKPSRMKRSTVSLGRQITVVHIVGLGLVTIYTGGIILKGAVIKAGSSAYNRVKNIIEPYLIADKIPQRLKKDPNTVDLGKFTGRVNGKTAFKDPKTGWVIESDNCANGHKGSKWKLRDKKGNRVASLRGNGDIAGK